MGLGMGSELMLLPITIAPEVRVSVTLRVASSHDTLGTNPGLMLRIRPHD